VSHAGHHSIGPSLQLGLHGLVDGFNVSLGQRHTCLDGRSDLNIFSSLLCSLIDQGERDLSHHIRCRLLPSCVAIGKKERGAEGDRDLTLTVTVASITSVYVHVYVCTPMPLYREPSSRDLHHQTRTSITISQPHSQFRKSHSLEY
jgi:hypothetical protein